MGRSRRRVVLNLPSKADVERWEDFKPKTRELKSACSTVRCCDEKESPFFRSLFSYSVLKTLYNALHGLKRDVKSFSNFNKHVWPLFAHFYLFLKLNDVATVLVLNRFVSTFKSFTPVFKQSSKFTVLSPYTDFNISRVFLALFCNLKQNSMLMRHSRSEFHCRHDFAVAALEGNLKL